MLIYQKILRQLDRQLNNFFTDVNMSVIESKIDEAYERCMEAIEASNNKYLISSGGPRFMLGHSGCWSIFLYYLSNSLKMSKGGGRTNILFEQDTAWC